MRGRVSIVQSILSTTIEYHSEYKCINIVKKWDTQISQPLGPPLPPLYHPGMFRK